MLWRISAALFALYLVHGADNVSRDGTRLAAEIRNDAPQAVVSFCVENPETCQKVLRQASNETAPEITPVLRRVEPQAPVSTSAAPVAADAFPLPPVRPAGLSLRKGA